VRQLLIFDKGIYFEINHIQNRLKNEFKKNIIIFLIENGQTYLRRKSELSTLVYSVPFILFGILEGI
jgi:predicted HTH domain antitoxin